MTENEISYKIRGAIFNVYNALGPGLLESIYEKALVVELKRKGLDVEEQVPINVIYNEQSLGTGFRIDILVEKKVIIELKSVKALEDVHYKQTYTYLKLSNKRLGLLVNFTTSDIQSSIKRIVNGL